MSTIKQKKAFKEVGVNGGIISKAMKVAGYSESVSRRTDKLTKTKGWQELLEGNLSDKDLAETHRKLLNSNGIEHMVFPTNITDEEIKDLLKSVNCEVRKIQHGDMAIHCWFWSPDNHARKDALDMAYKLKGKYAPEKHQVIVAELPLKEKKQLDKLLN